MNAIQNFTIFVLMISLASCEERRENHYEIHAEVVHEDGSPVENANLVALTLKAKQEKPMLITSPERTEIVMTDANGVAVLRFQSIPTPGGGVGIGKKS